MIDTNVPIAANGRNTHASNLCRLNCIQNLLEIQRNGKVVIDNQGLILSEYQGRLNFSGQPDVGDEFFVYIFNNQYNPNKVVLAPITPNPDTRRGFDELPPNFLDPSDRKFLAAAVITNAPILNALDSDWAENGELLEQLGVQVIELCQDLLPNP